MLLTLAVLSLSPKTNDILGLLFSWSLRSDRASYGISRWTLHGLEIMFMPLPALCVFQHHTFSLHPCCVCVWELFFDICWRKLLIYSLGGLPSHTCEVLERCDFLTLQNRQCDPIKGTSGWHRKLYVNTYLAWGILLQNPEFKVFMLKIDWSRQGWMQSFSHLQVMYIKIPFGWI